MDANFNAIMALKIQKTMESLRKNNMDAYYVNSGAEVPALVATLCPEGSVVANGGSMTLSECGVMSLLRSGKYKFLDRDAPGADVQKVFRDAFSCDTYLMSTNAVTEAGELYNADGNSNRVAALMFGPKQVLVIAGYNKIVRDINAAIRRVREIAAPTNAYRLNCQTPCRQVGTCCDCHGDARICCNFVISGHQRVKGRIKVVLVGEPLGY